MTTVGAFRGTPLPEPLPGALVRPTQSPTHSTMTVSPCPTPTHSVANP
jgi:hypothetical protein